ncbi:unnamed protein product, partial [Closterium sp. NIES-54]
TSQNATSNSCYLHVTCIILTTYMCRVCLLAHLSPPGFHLLLFITVATPKQIKELMKVDGLTSDKIKSHLQVMDFSVLSNHGYTCSTT